MSTQPTPGSEPGASVPQQDLQAEIDRLNKVIRALIGRIEREGAMQGRGAYAHFQAAVALEGLVHERTAALETALTQIESAHDESLAAKRAADRANEAKSRFLAVLSHEIRTPMTGLTGALDMLARTPLDASQRKLHETMQVAADNLMRVINDVLDFSRIEGGKIEFASEAFSPRILVRDVATLYQPQADLAGLELHTVVEDRMPERLLGDEGRLRQVLNNVVSNAIKFTDEGHVELLAALERADRSVAEVRFTITDTGPGVPEAERERIFDSFHQAAEGASRGRGGTGLGLAIADRFIRGMGGRIWVEEGERGGACFQIQVPLAWTSCARSRQGSAREVGPPDTVLPPTEPVAREAIDFVRSRVLVADDNDVNRDFLVQALEMWGYEADVAPNGRTALSKTIQHTPDLILMDWRMPVMDGLEATKAIRSWEQGSGRECPLPIIGITANALPGDRETCLEAGMTDFLAKPFPIDALERVVARWLKLSRT